MVTIEKLQSFGADTTTGLARCYGNEALYLRLVAMIPDEKHFDLLKDAVAQNDLHAAFDAAHALKGVLGNLSLTPIYDAMTALTDLLRAETAMDYSDSVSAILEMRETLRTLCNS